MNNGGYASFITAFGRQGPEVRILSLRPVFSNISNGLGNKRELVPFSLCPEIPRLFPSFWGMTGGAIRALIGGAA